MTADFLRAAHSGQAAAGSVLVVEVPAHDEAPSVDAAAATAPPTIDRVRGRVATPEAARALARMPRGASFAPRTIVCHPEFKTHNRRRLEWLRRRRSELHQSTGGVSHGVGAYLVSASWLFAAGEFAAERAAGSGDLEAFKVAASLTQTARQHDLAAWSLAVREGQARQDHDGDDLRQRQAAFQRQLAERQKGGTP